MVSLTSSLKPEPRGCNIIRSRFYKFTSRATQKCDGKGYAAPNRVTLKPGTKYLMPTIKLNHFITASLLHDVMLNPCSLTNARISTMGVTSN